VASAVAQEPLRMRGGQGATSTGCLRQEAAPPLPHRGRNGIQSGCDCCSSSSWSLTDSSKTSATFCLCCASGRLKIVWYGWLRHGFCSQCQQSCDVDPSSSMGAWFCGWCQSLQALLASRICRTRPRKRLQVPLNAASAALRRRQRGANLRFWMWLSV